MNPPPAANRYLKQGILPCTAGDTIKMNIATPWAFKPTTAHQHSNFPIHGFVEKYQNGLHHAAYLLAGSDGANLIEMISDALSREIMPSRRTMGLISQLCRNRSISKAAPEIIRKKRAKEIGVYHPRSQC